MADSRTILLSGGGTGGSVTTLLALSKELLKTDNNLNLVFVGTTNGPEKSLVSAFSVIKHIKFTTLPSGKFRRYFSVHNFLDIFKIIAAFALSFSILNKEKPEIVISGGGFVSVPLVWAAYLKQIPILIHQQDVRPGLANRLMAPFARVITVTFEKSLNDYGAKAVWTGNPSNQLEVVNNLDEILIKYNIKKEVPLILVTGGGTGSQALNEIVRDSLSSLVAKYQVIHLTGKGKMIQLPEGIQNYHAYEFLSNDEVFALMSVSDLIISRCGLATLTEIAELRKPAILIPMPNSHQEDNANIFKRQAAAIVLDQSNLNEINLVSTIQEIMKDKDRANKLSSNISKIMKKDASETIAEIIWEILQK